jgi:hypothetical protein
MPNALSGAKREAVPLCKEAVSLAEQTKDPWLLSRAKLTLAEALLESGDHKTALENSLATVDGFEHTQQKDSEWFALLIAARASQTGNDTAKAHEYAIAPWNYSKDSNKHGDRFLSQLSHETGCDVLPPATPTAN